MDDSIPRNRFVKSPLVFLFLVSVLVVSTLVVASEYFLRPQIELELKQKITHRFAQVGLAKTNIELSGRDVILNGSVKSKDAVMRAERATKEIWGIRQVDNQILIKN